MGSAGTPARIAIISGPTDYLCARARLEACRATLDTAGLRVDDRLVRAGHFQFDDGLRLATELLGLPQRPTAIACGNDLQAMGAYEAAGAWACASRRASASSASTTTRSRPGAHRG